MLPHEARRRELKREIRATEVVIGGCVDGILNAQSRIAAQRAAIAGMRETLTEARARLRQLRAELRQLG